MNFNFNSLLNALAKAVRGLGERVNRWGASNPTGRAATPPLSRSFTLGPTILSQAPPKREQMLGDVYHTAGNLRQGAKNLGEAAGTATGVVPYIAHGQTPSYGPSSQGFLTPSYNPYTPPSTKTAPAPSYTPPSRTGGGTTKTVPVAGKFVPPAHNIVGTNGPTLGGTMPSNGGSASPTTRGYSGGGSGGGYSVGGSGRSGYSSGSVGVKGQAAPSPSPLPPPEVTINKPAGTFEAMNRALQRMNPQSAYLAKPLTNASPYGPATNQGDILKRLRRYIR